MNIIINPLTAAEQQFLWEMLYLAIYVPPGTAPLPQNIVQQPDIAMYAAGWGQSTDIGLYALDAQTDTKIGAAWLRLFTAEHKGYGYIDDATPELSMAIVPGYRGQGVGSQLLTELLLLARNKYSSVSLSVATGNPAVNLYTRFGFATVCKDEHSLVMLKRL